ncbi:MAG: hypothetical protein Q8P32_00125 [Candidatus Komeilibacteria bacterium]|nr:hypothetical protein [Candidatus Komeilibacteria bacterium]
MEPDLNRLMSVLVKSIKTDASNFGDRSDIMLGDERNWAIQRTDLVNGYPEAMEEIARRAQLEIGDLDKPDNLAVYIALHIKRLDASRRVSQPDGQKIERYFAEIDERLKLLPADHFRKIRLQELPPYHMSQVAGGLGRFAEAAKQFRQVAEKAEAEFDQALDASLQSLQQWHEALEKNESAIETAKQTKGVADKKVDAAYLTMVRASYEEARFGLKDALANQSVPLDFAVTEFEGAVKNLWKFCQKPVADPNEAFERQRWALNAWYNWQVYHLLIVNFELGDGQISWTLDLPSEVTVPESLHSSFEGSHCCLLALMTADQDMEAAVKWAEKAKPADPEWYSLALLLKSCYLRALAGWHDNEDAEALIERSKRAVEELKQMNWACHLAQALNSQLGF